MPQDNADVLNGAGVNRVLTTWQGVADLRLLSVEDFQRDILAHVPQDGPIDLMEAAFNVPTALVDEELLRDKIIQTIYRLARVTILASVFSQLCPNFTDKPQAAVEALWQTFTNAEGNVVSHTIAVFSSIFLNALRPMVGLDTWPIDVVALYISRLNKDIRAVVEELYPQHSDPHDRNGTSQRTQLAVVIRHSVVAEKRVLNMKSICVSQMGQSFYSPVPVNPVLPSQAEKTLGHYENPDSPSRKRQPVEALKEGQECFGCGEIGKHPWSKCPHRNNPECKARAKLKAAEFRKTQRTQRIAGSREKRLARGEPNLADLSGPAQERLASQLAARGAPAPAPSAAVGTAPHLPGAGRGRGRGTSPFILLMDAMVLNNAVKPNLPVPINSNLPHIRLKLGPADGEHDPIEITAVVDTAASLNTASLPFIKKVAATFPWIVHSIFGHKDYNPITLSGVVAHDGAPVTTALTAAFAFHTPYVTKDGHNATFLVAAGEHVGVNLILGIPFIEATQMLIDFSDRCVECRALDSPPFPMLSKRAVLELPAVAESDVADASSYEPFRGLVATLSDLGSDVATVQAVPEGPSSKKVKFQVDAADQVAAELAARKSPSATDAYIAPALSVLRDETTLDSDWVDGNHDTVGVEEME